MPASTFRPEERKLFLKYLDQWQGLIGCGKQRDEDGDLINPKDELVDTIIQEFFETFPERDSLQHATGDLVLRPDVRDKLHSVSFQFV
jgi:hypothetical protein